MNKTEILKNLHELDEECLREDIELRLVIIGGAAFIVSYGLPRATYDIDVIGRMQSQLLTKYHIEVVNEGILCLPEDYSTRLQAIDGFKKIKVVTLGAIDLILTKIGRGSPKDVDDCKHLLRMGEVNREELIKVFGNWKHDFVGNMAKLEGTFQWVIEDE